MTREIEKQAQAYVDRVLESQRELGHESKLTDEEYRRAVDNAARAFADLSEPEKEPDGEPDGEPVPA